MLYSISVLSTGLGILGVGQMWDTVWKGSDRDTAEIELAKAVNKYPNNKVMLLLDPDDGKIYI